jgi:hypothetical protein
VITSRKNITEDFASDVSLQNLGGDLARCSLPEIIYWVRLLERWDFKMYLFLGFPQSKEL